METFFIFSFVGWAKARPRPLRSKPVTLRRAVPTRLILAADRVGEPPQRRGFGAHGSGHRRVRQAPQPTLRPCQFRRVGKGAATAAPVKTGDVAPRRAHADLVLAAVRV